MMWDQHALEAWLEESARRDEDALVIQKYKKQDDSKIKVTSDFLSTAGKRRRRSNSNVDTDVTTLTTDSSTDGAKVKNRREKQFIVDLLKNAEEKKEAV